MGTKITRVKKHFKDHQKTYWAGAIGLVVGVTAAMIFTRSEVNVTNDSYKLELFKYKSPTTNTVVTVLERRGHPGNVIRWNQTGELFGSQERAAEVAGISSSSLSQHLNGKLSSVKGQTFTNLGENLQSQEKHVL